MLKRLKPSQLPAILFLRITHEKQSHTLIVPVCHIISAVLRQAIEYIHSCSCT
jgi:hypothetical protein